MICVTLLCSVAAPATVSGDNSVVGIIYELQKGYCVVLLLQIVYRLVTSSTSSGLVKHFKIQYMFFVLLAILNCSVIFYFFCVQHKPESVLDKYISAKPEMYVVMFVWV